VSDNRWTSNEIGLYWLEHVFNKYTTTRIVGIYRLLILDGYSSYTTPEFDQYCLAYSIIVLCMLAYLLYLLQLLNISCFTELKRSYSKLVKTKIGLSINYINK
jgi:hypothetical protein